MRWSLTRNGKTVVEPSRLGLSFSMFKVPNRSLGEMRIIKKDTRHSDTTLTNEIYRRRTIRDRYNELSVTLEEVDEPRRRLGFVFRAYDEGAAFRYVVPEQDGVEGFELLREHTEWRFPGKCRGWFTSYDNEFNSNEQPFCLRGMDNLSDGEWKMDVYVDDPELTPADPKAIRLSATKVSSTESVTFDLVDEGGAVAVFSRIR